MNGIKRRSFLKVAAVGALACTLAGGDGLMTANAVRAEDFPTRPVTIIVPFAAGAALDGIARTLGQKLTDRWGKPIVVENRAGAAGMTGAAAAAKAPSDGYTLFMGSSSSLAIVATLRKELPYNPAKDFVPLALVAQIPFVLVVHPSLPVHSVADLVNLAKEKPGSLSYASGGPGHPAHIYAEMLKHVAGIDMAHVPYKGTAPALNDLVGGHIPLMFADLLPSQQLIAENRIRALAVSSVTRAPSLPEVPPLAEVGIPGFDAAGWAMLVAPANTPTEIVNKLHSEIAIVLGMPEVKAWIVNNGMTPVGVSPPKELQAYVTSETLRWSQILERIGLARSQ